MMTHCMFIKGSVIHPGKMYFFLQLSIIFKTQTNLSTVKSMVCDIQNVQDDVSKGCKGWKKYLVEHEEMRKDLMKKGLWQ